MATVYVAVVGIYTVIGFAFGFTFVTLNCVAVVALVVFFAITASVLMC